MCSSCTFSTWNEPAISTIAVHMHSSMFYMRICAYFGARFMSIGVKLVLGTKPTLKRNLIRLILSVHLQVYGIMRNKRYKSLIEAEEQSGPSLHCLPFHLHLLDALLYSKTHYLNFRIITLFQIFFI